VGEKAAEGEGEREREKLERRNPHHHRRVKLGHNPTQFLDNWFNINYTKLPT